LDAPTFRQILRQAAGQIQVLAGLVGAETQGAQLDSARQTKGQQGAGRKGFQHSETLLQCQYPAFFQVPETR